ncbi:AraD1 family protein [Histidinibacterium lentulum]|uniref:GguC protein n=1 Tax=Histidinibacterium lentulum TaxID=2480588 RepID=A0A3N2R9C8_9RHOB|nr:AraD1 family protein [Histidinibacterium lentulum]ROU04072.1 GguC protein [Histidinibacterium lentulum]
MLLSQYRREDGGIRLVAREGHEAFEVRTNDTLRDLALACAASGTRLRERILALGLGAPVDLAAAYDGGRLLPPLTHPDPAHLFVTGTGLTHLGSASTRAAMHATAPEDETDSMKMFRMGLEGGKPSNGAAGVQPEWFYKGSGDALVAPGAALERPLFAEDGGEEPEIAGLYVIDSECRPFRVGFALGNEFSDHIMERRNYLYLAHSKLRQASVGPEVLIGDLPEDISGTSRIRRGNETIFEKPFLSGEANMSHSIANLEHHHFKYDIFRRPGDVHVHMFGTATLSFADGVAPADGDVFEIEAVPFGLPLRNPLKVTAGPVPEPRTAIHVL